MCGICGFFTENSISVDELARMNDSMIHRGPNDGGVEIVQVPTKVREDIFYLGLAQRRLSIQDLSSRGHQPMHSIDGKVSLVFNGEIYNYKELRKKLDYPFESDCDTEVIIAAYLKWGIKCIEQFNGMFAIALYDHDEKKLFLVRDRLGVKPLYYWYTNHGIVFASELKSIMYHADFSEGINVQLLLEYFVKKYIVSPNTIFSNVYKLEPGTYLEFDGKDICKYKYWNMADFYRNASGTTGGEVLSNFRDAKEMLRSELENAIRYRFISDVPIGLFLSGGYDSSLVAAIAQSVSDVPLRTFSIGFEDRDISESDYAIAVAQHIGTRHIDRVITEEDMLELIEELPYYYDEPFADGSQLPMMMVSKLAKDEGVTVVLTGDGGDELFCGYQSYIPGIRNNVKYRISDMIRTNLVKNFLNGESDVVKGMYDETKYLDISDKQIRKMFMDVDTYLPDDICCKVDRATMKYSLEARCPFLDKNVVELSCKIPQQFKYYDGKLKYILKELACDYIPPNLLERPKQGFGIPYNKWLHGKLKDKLIKYSAVDFVRKQGIFDEKKINIFINQYLKQGEGTKPDYSDIVWAYLMFQSWYEKWNEKAVCREKQGDKL